MRRSGCNPGHIPTHMLICSRVVLAAVAPVATTAVLAPAVILAPAPASAQEEVMTRYGYEDRADLDLAAIFEPKWDVMVPMRDGVRLHTEIYIPRGRTEPLPIMLERTPYYANPQEQEYSIRLDWYEEFFDEGYIFVLQDLRGRYESEGEFVTLRPNRKPDDVDGTDESTDFYDTIEWLVNNVPANNGRVGTWGISYGGFLATRAMVDPHPALAAVSPQASCADMFIGDDFHHNGAFRFQLRVRGGRAVRDASGVVAPRGRLGQVHALSGDGPALPGHRDARTAIRACGTTTWRIPTWTSTGRPRCAASSRICRA